MMSGIYLDHHATTPVDRRVAEAVMHQMVEEYGNANSVDHVHGERAAAAVESAAEAVADLFDADPDHVLFTSGSTHAVELAISHALGSVRHLPLRIVLSRVEHPAVLEIARRAERLGLASLQWLDVGSDASLEIGQLDALLPRADLLCLMAANNEVGTIYPVAEAFERAADAGVAMLVDATQAAGRVRLDLSTTPFDYFVISGHKIYGPKGVGALISPVFRPEQCHGLAGSHAATPNVPGIVGLGLASRIMAEEGFVEDARLRGLSALMLSNLRSLVPDLVSNGSEQRLGGNLHISAPGAPNDMVVARLRGQVAISTGAACMSGAQAASHVLQAMNLPVALQDSALRIGLGRHTTEENVLDAANLIGAAIAAVRTSLEPNHA